MALHDVYADVYFTDAAERTAMVSYLLDVQYDDTTPNMPAVETAFDALITALNLLSWAAINRGDMRIQMHTATDTANVSSNNQIHARSYGVDTGGNRMSFDVVAWDDFTYDQDEFNLLSTAYNTAALGVQANIRNPETGLAMTADIARSVSRTHKSRGKKVV